MRLRLALKLLFSACFIGGFAVAAPTIKSVSLPASPLSQYTRSEFQFQIEGEKGDPFDQRQLALDLVVSAPSGKTLRVPGFYDHASVQKGWKVRFTPQESGAYRFTAEFRQTGEAMVAQDAGSVSVIASRADGFLHPNDLWTFRFDSGRVFRAIGENVCWEGKWRDKNYTYDLILSELSLNGANFYRTWMCYWNLPVEWKKVQPGGINQDTTSVYNESAVRRFDELLDLNERLGMYMMLAMDWHGALMTGDKWPQYNYNKINGGPCETPRDFFTHPEARAMYKNRLRYLVARFGASPSIASWEFFNEIDNASFPEKIPHEEVTAWHREMSDYVKQIDPYGRIVTTSVSHRDIDGMNDLPSIDLNQRHIYIRTSEIPSTIRSYTEAHKKPYAIGEAGYDWDWNKIHDWRGEEFDDHFERGLWYGLFSPTPVLPMSWWWEFFHERKMVPTIRPVRAIHERMLAEGGGQFSDLAIESKTFETLAVACGKTLFIYVRNKQFESASDEVRLPAIKSGRYSREEFNPKDSTVSHGDALTAAEAGLVIGKLELRRGEQRILMLRPLP